MTHDLVPRGAPTPVRRVPTRLNRRISRIEEEAIVQASEVQAALMVGRVAQAAVTQLAMYQGQLQCMLSDDHGAQLAIAAVGEATIAKIQMIIIGM